MADQKTTSIDNGRTVRQRIADQLEALIGAMTDDTVPLWAKVYFGDVENIPNDVLPVCAIDVGTEIKQDSYGGCTHYDLPVFFHFRYRGQRGLDETDKFHYYLGMLQKAVLADHNLGGLTLDVEEEDNAHTIIGIEDVYPGGTLHVTVKYRTRLHNPYKLVTEN